MSARRTLGAALRGFVFVQRSALRGLAFVVTTAIDNADAAELARVERDEARDAYEAASEAIRELTDDERTERAKAETFRVGLNAVHQDLVDVRRELDAARLAAKADDEVHVQTCAALETVRGERDWAVARKGEVETSLLTSMGISDRLMGERDSARKANRELTERAVCAERERDKARTDLRVAAELGAQARARNATLEDERDAARTAEAAGYEREAAVKATYEARIAALAALEVERESFASAAISWRSSTEQAREQLKAAKETIAETAAALETAERELETARARIATLDLTRSAEAEAYENDVEGRTARIVTLVNEVNRLTGRIGALESELAAWKLTRTPWVAEGSGDYIMCYACARKGRIAGIHPVTRHKYCDACNGAAKTAWEAGK